MSNEFDNFFPSQKARNFFNEDQEPRHDTNALLYRDQNNKQVDSWAEFLLRVRVYRLRKVFIFVKVINPTIITMAFFYFSKQNVYLIMAKYTPYVLIIKQARCNNIVFYISIKSTARKNNTESTWTNVNTPISAASPG